MARPRIPLLDSAEIERIQGTSLRSLAEVGVHVPHAEALERLRAAGAKVDRGGAIARLPERVVLDAVAAAGKRYVLHGRSPGQVARYGHGDCNLMSTPGQFAWFEAGTGQRRDPTLADARAAITLGDALPNVTVVGAMAVPLDIPTPIRDVVTTAALVRGTGKPTRTWPVSRASTQHVLAIYEAVAGGTAALRERPMVETFLEPISPLRFPETGLDVMITFIERGQPVSVGPMVMASGTGPATLAGTLAQENAGILAGIAIVQAFAPGHAMMYGGIPHVMDPRTSTCSFGSPEQGLMALAMAQVGQAYGFPVYVNSNLTDAKRLDAQAGIEKAASLVMSVIGGADQLGHAGIVGADHGAGLDWLVVDDEALGFAKRIARGFEVNDDTLAYDVIAAVGSSGDFLAEEHTVTHFRRELFLPSPRWTREPYDAWNAGGALDMGDRARARVDEVLASHAAPPLDAALDRELDEIVASARRLLDA
jgi:trimethylamine--corrinoid protein Co-methyltransferase